MRNRMPTIREQESEAGSRIASSRNWELDNSPGLKNRLSSESIGLKRFSKDSEQSNESRNKHSPPQKKDEGRWQTSQFNSSNPGAKEPVDQLQQYRAFYAQRLPFQTSKPLKAAQPDRQQPQRPTLRPAIRNRNLTPESERRAGNKANVPNFGGQSDSSRDVGYFEKSQEPNFPFKDNANNPRFDPKKPSQGEFRVLNLTRRIESGQKPQTQVTGAALQDNLRIQQAPTFNPSTLISDQAQNRNPEKEQSQQIKIQEGFLLLNGIYLI